MCFAPRGSRASIDGSGAGILKHDGYNVTIVQIPTSSLADDAAFSKRVLGKQSGPVVLVGHFYGGAVITEKPNRDSCRFR
ncbi:hypothetical protein FHW69_003748 [Luteibacter sp. Sphag1AF]|uniref:hypothetical protein n=1 Tax=Luteibacter sp. Sphag1AF TaxID=2587031 RepID=UPI001802BA91|nr:hypothetical protein [Luteibacter sp. Sphag1AF]MBB3229096.1 hypothetical protein [Luteibacter sp. Sphag1AF]